MQQQTSTWQIPPNIPPPAPPPAPPPPAPSVNLTDIRHPNTVPLLPIREGGMGLGSSMMGGAGGGGLGSQWLMQLAGQGQAQQQQGSGDLSTGGSGQSQQSQTGALTAAQRNALTFDSAGRVLINVRGQTQGGLDALQQELQAQGMVVTQVTPDQNLVT